MPPMCKRTVPHPPHPTNDARLQAALAAADWPLLTRLCRQTLRKHSRDLAAHRLLGFALNKQHRFDLAVPAYRQAAAFWPNDAELLINYANVLIEHAQNSDALPLLEKVCELRPQQAISWIKMAQCCYLLALNEKAFQAAEKAEGLAQGVAEKVAVYTQKAIHRRELGQVREAVRDCEAAIDLCPTDIASHTNRLLFMLADPAATPHELTAAAKAYGTAAAAICPEQASDFQSQGKNPWKRLKIGFLSPDFRAHAVMYFVEGLLAQLDRRQFEVYAFYLFPKEDHITARVKCHADHFVHLANRLPHEQAQTIRGHDIDILIDLAGHTGSNGLLAMALRAAPIQVSWLGFPATTGLSTMDYKFTDEVTDPADADVQYTERLYRLPTLFCCYRPMGRNPLWRYQPRYLVRDTPALAKGHITFGSCNNLGKLTDEVLSLWARILQAVPGARLLIEGKGLGDGLFRDNYRARCAKLGLPPERLDLLPLSTDNQYLTYHDIDIALDPFPLTGGTTSFDVLWMGVPLVSMEGASFKSRMGVGLLSYLGRTEWLASTAEQYLQIACHLAHDVQALNTIRQGLRQAVEHSPLMDEAHFCHAFGEGLRVMWLQWLAQGLEPEDEAQQMRQMQAWLPDMPTEWERPTQARVGIAPGRAVPQTEAHALLEDKLQKAKTLLPQASSEDGQIHHRAWKEVTELAETVLCAIPHDPVALACLAEVEFAHGHTDFAVTYLRYATASMSHQH